MGTLQKKKLINKYYAKKVRLGLCTKGGCRQQTQQDKRMCTKCNNAVNKERRDIRRKTLGERPVKHITPLQLLTQKYSVIREIVATSHNNIAVIHINKKGEPIDDKV